MYSGKVLVYAISAGINRVMSGNTQVQTGISWKITVGSALLRAPLIHALQILAILSKEVGFIQTICCLAEYIHIYIYIFQIQRPLQNFRCKMVTRRNSHTLDPQILFTAVQNLFPVTPDFRDLCPVTIHINSKDFPSDEYIPRICFRIK